MPRPEDTAFLFPSEGKRKETSTETVHELPGIVYMICCSPFSFFLSFFVLFLPPFMIIFFSCLSFYLISLFSFVLLKKEQRESLTFSAKRERLICIVRLERFFVTSSFSSLFLHQNDPFLISGTRSVYLDLIGKRMT